MKLWKRIVFSVISLVLGICSLDYLYYAFRLLTDANNSARNYNPKGDGLMQLLGAGMFFLWFIILAFYYYLIRKSSTQIDYIVTHKRSGKEKIKRKWFDVIFQGTILITGMLLRWFYLIYFFFPKCK